MLDAKISALSLEINFLKFKLRFKDEDLSFSRIQIHQKNWQLLCFQDLNRDLPFNEFFWIWTLLFILLFYSFIFIDETDAFSHADLKSSFHAIPSHGWEQTKTPILIHKIYSID